MTTAFQDHCAEALDILLNSDPHGLTEEQVTLADAHLTAARLTSPGGYVAERELGHLRRLLEYAPRLSESRKQLRLQAAALDAHFWRQLTLARLTPGTDLFKAFANSLVSQHFGSNLVSAELALDRRSLEYRLDGKPVALDYLIDKFRSKK